MRERQDGECEWVDLNNVKHSFSNDCTIAYKEKKLVMVSKLAVGTRLSIWWTAEKVSFDGILSKINETCNEKPRFVEYEDGGTEWTNLNFRSFQVIPSWLSALTIGQRISVWFDDSYYDGTLLAVQVGVVNLVRQYGMPFFAERIHTSNNALVAELPYMQSLFYVQYT